MSQSRDRSYISGITALVSLLFVAKVLPTAFYKFIFCMFTLLCSSTLIFATWLNISLVHDDIIQLRGQPIFVVTSMQFLSIVHYV